MQLLKTTYMGIYNLFIYLSKFTIGLLRISKLFEDEIG